MISSPRDGDDADIESTFDSLLSRMSQGYSECCSVSLPVESIMSDEEVFLIEDAEQMCPGERVC